MFRFNSENNHPDGPRINKFVESFFDNLNEEFDYSIYGDIDGFGSFCITAWAFKNAKAKLKCIDPNKGYYSFEVKSVDSELMDQLLHDSWYWSEEERQHFVNLKSISYRFKFPESLMCDYDISDVFESVSVLPDVVNL